MDTGRPVDSLRDREAHTFASWLRAKLSQVKDRCPHLEALAGHVTG